MKITLLLSLLLLNFSIGWACGSYEACMKGDPIENNGDGNASNDRMDEDVENHLNYQKAIAYKLDEISKKLDINKYGVNKTFCDERNGKYFILGTTIQISKNSCSDVVT